MKVDDAMEVEQLRAQLQRLQREARRKDEFLAMVAHELRAPLGAILGWAHLLRRRGGEEEFQNGLDVIEQSVQVQDRLVDDLLVLSRAAAARVGLRLELLEPARFVDAAIDSVRPAADSAGLQLCARFEAASGWVRGDAARLQQVMSNLLSNAIKFTPRGGTIDVTLRRSRGWAVIAVTDTGRGIARAFLPHVFERFRQDPDAASAHRGLGLGLAITRELVELHGGEIDAASDGEGRGATFTVRLPLVDAPAAAAAAPEATPPATPR